VGRVLHRLVEIVHVELSHEGLKIGVFEVPGEGRGGGEERGGMRGALGCLEKGLYFGMLGVGWILECLRYP